MTSLEKLGVFLSYNFYEDAKKGLYLAVDKENGNLVKLNWNNLPLRDKWLTYDSSLESIARVIQEALRPSSLSPNTNLEAQVFLFRKKIKRHNERLFQNRIHFFNPFKKSIAVEVSYPHYIEALDRIELRALHINVSYSRFSPCEKIWRKIQKEIPVSVAWKSDQGLVQSLNDAVKEKETLDYFIKKFSLDSISLKFKEFNLRLLVSFVGKEFFKMGYDTGFIKGVCSKKDPRRALYPKPDYQELASKVLSRNQ